MKVTVSVGGRFHAFYLAAELEKRHYLQRLITSYPRYLASRFGVPKSAIRSVVIKEILERGWRRLPSPIRRRINPQYFVSILFDRLATRYVESSDIFVGWSTFALASLKKARNLGAVTILDRGSSHMLHQEKILLEEYERWGVRIEPFMVPHPKIVKRELEEYAAADYIAVPSLYVKRTFLEQGVPESKIIHVPYGVNLDAFHQARKEDGVFRVIFVGGMTLRKGVHYLLKAFYELKLQNAELLFVGAMNKEIVPFFKKYEGSFRHLGHVPQNELYKQYSQGSVFALPSIEEGLAMVQPQAMACGLPVICTTNTGGEDIVRNGIDGFVIPIRDVEALKEKILWMYEHPEERKRMGESAKARVNSGFTWKDYGDKMIAEFQRVLRP
jgi:glycosyltransferase involved in cell wall biosynthesis